MIFSTEQENFWAGEFGDDYISRNQGENLISGNINLFSRILKSAPGVNSIAELGCNVALNLQALNRINKNYDLRGYEINKDAASIASTFGVAEIFVGTIINPLPTEKKFDMVFTKNVLIHINPDKLDGVYENLFSLSKKFILISEYYSPTPVTVTYRANEDRLFKRDFAGELIKRFNLRLVDYGFNYHGDPHFPNDDATWFLMEKI